MAPHTSDRSVATRWLLDRDAVGRDGVVARHEDGRRWLRVRRVRTVACVVTGFRPRKRGGRLGAARSLRGGSARGGRRTTAFRRAPVRRAAAAALAHVAGGSASPDQDTDWIEVSPALVCEVRVERLSGLRFRNAAEFVRWLPDRDPRTCGGTARTFLDLTHRDRRASADPHVVLARIGGREGEHPGLRPRARCGRSSSRGSPVRRPAWPHRPRAGSSTSATTPSNRNVVTVLVPAAAISSLRSRHHQARAVGVAEQHVVVLGEELAAPERRDPDAGRWACRTARARLRSGRHGARVGAGRTPPAAASGPTTTACP